MAALLLILALLGQGIPISPAQSGVITGTLKADTGKPAAGVRVAVLAVTEKADDINYAAAMTSQGETDNEGHFRLENIPPGRYYITAGRHIIVLQDATGSRFYAAFVSVADQDVDGVTLDSAGVLPNNPNWSSTAANGASGARPLAGLLGRVFEEDSGKPLNRGMVTVLGQSMATISIGADGKFIIPRLVPGSYDLRIEAFEHFTLYQTIDITDEDKHLDFKIRSNLASPIEQ